MKTIGGQQKAKFRERSRRMVFHLRGSGLQSGAVAPVGSCRMSAPARCKLVGRWPIVEADI
jgi:hypothetical protein